MVDTDAETREIWYVSRSGARYGPYSAAILKAWINSGQLATDVTLSNGGPAMTLTEFLSQDGQQAEIPSLSDMEAKSEPVTSPDDTALTLAPEEQPTRIAPTPPAPRKPQVQESEPELLSELPAALPLPPEPPQPREHDAERTHMAMVVATPDDAPPTRDRIVILGRRRSGKTVYLAALYAMLWKSLDSVTAKAISGTGHKELMAIAQTLKSGQWPHATQAMMQVPLELEFRNRKRLMVVLDFAGELFSKAFLHDQGGSPEVKPLLDHIDHAAAVMLLVDPSVAVGQDHQAIMEDDFGLVQAVQRIRNWPGGEEVPIVIVLTKADLHQQILDRFGGPVGFVRAHFPALVRLIKKVPIFQVSAVQSQTDISGKAMPKADSVQVNVEKPLLYCLNLVEKQDRIDEQRKAQERRQAAMQQYEQEQMRTEKRQVRWLTAAIISIFVLGAAAVTAIVMYRF